METTGKRSVKWVLAAGWLAICVGCGSSGNGLGLPSDADNGTQPNGDVGSVPTNTDGGAATSADTGRAETGAVDSGVASGRGFPATSPWLVYYDTAESMGDLAAVANKFRIIDIDVDPGLGNFTKEQVTQLKGGGKNRVLGYMNLGACESFRTYWATSPTGFLSCQANKAAQLGAYDGWDNETWMNLGNADYQKLVVDYIAPGVASLGVDGFYFDNLDIIEHGTSTTNGPCNAACVQGALDTVRKLREKYPNFLFVMQNAVGSETLEGTTGGQKFPSLLDGVVGENTFTPLPNGDSSLLSDLLEWKALNLQPGGRSFFIGTLEYLSNCNETSNLTKVVDLGKTNGFSSYVAKDTLDTICPYWMK